MLSLPNDTHGRIRGLTILNGHQIQIDDLKCRAQWFEWFPVGISKSHGGATFVGGRRRITTILVVLDGLDIVKLVKQFDNGNVIVNTGGGGIIIRMNAITFHTGL